jgi:hypothetical protein
MPRSSEARERAKNAFKRVAENGSSGSLFGPTCHTRNRSGPATFFNVDRAVIDKSQALDIARLASIDSTHFRALLGPGNERVRSLRRQWQKLAVLPFPHRRLSLPHKAVQRVRPSQAPVRSPHCRLSLPRKDLERAWHHQAPVRLPDCRLSLPRKVFRRAKRNGAPRPSPQDMTWESAPRPRPANRKLAVKKGPEINEASETDCGHHVVRLWPRSRFSARGPGWPACPQGAERFGKRLHWLLKPAVTRRNGGSCPTSEGLLPISLC